MKLPPKWRDCRFRIKGELTGEKVSSLVAECRADPLVLEVARLLGCKRVNSVSDRPMVLPDKDPRWLRRIANIMGETPKPQNIQDAKDIINGK